MKNLKPFLLGSITGCGVMFLALQYHVVQSHDGLQLIPRAPQASLGLAWADVREWDAETWAERPELARALVAHGSSDLISESVARAIADSADPDSSTIGQLRALLNSSMSSEFDAPLFEEDRRRYSGDGSDDGLTIPFMQGQRGAEWGDLSSTGRFGSQADTTGRSSTGFSDLDEVITEEQQQRARNHYTRRPDQSSFDAFSQAESSWGSSQTDADSRRRDTTILEDLLFSDDDGAPTPPDSMDSAMRDSRFGSMTDALDSRASRALDRARLEFFEQQPGASTGSGSRGVVDWTIPPDSDDSVPHAVRALREGFDPFNE